MNDLIEVRGLCKRYAGFALEDVSFDVPKGYIMGFVGPNGAGKTTTIKSILHMIEQDAGEIRLFGKNPQTDMAEITDKIGVVMDAPFYAEDWTMRDVEGAVSPFYSQWDTKRYTELLSRFHIDKAKRVKELSRGMKVKLMLTVALSHDAQLLILDEPTSGLDPVARDELCELLCDFVSDESRSVLFSTHITGDLEKIADYITFILNGRIVFSGLKDDLMEAYVVVKGGRNELSAAQKKGLIGLREHGTGFEGLAARADLASLPKGLLTEPITLEELVVYMNKGAGGHA